MPGTMVVWIEQVIFVKILVCQLKEHSFFQYFAKTGSKATGLQFFGITGSYFFSRGTTFASFQIDGNSDLEMERLIMWVNAGKISFDTSLIIQVFI